MFTRRVCNARTGNTTVQTLGIQTHEDVIRERDVCKCLNLVVFRQSLTARVSDLILSDKINIAKAPARYVTDGPNDQ